MPLDINGTYTVHVKRWFKKVSKRDPQTNVPAEYKSILDWDLGMIVGAGSVAGEYYVAGSPLQLVPDLAGDPINDSRILVQEEELPLSQIAGAARDLPPTSTLHYKNPNI